MFHRNECTDLPTVSLRRRIGYENHWHIQCGDGREYCFAATGGRPFPRKRSFFLFGSSLFKVGRTFFQPAQQLLPERSPLLPCDALLLANGAEQDLLSFWLISAFFTEGGVS
jgi:hypothetical protein